MVIVQSVAQIVAVSVLRSGSRTWPGLPMLYPLPSVVAAVGWLTIYGFAQARGHSPDRVVAGLARPGLRRLPDLGEVERAWPFGPKEFRETPC